MISIQSLTRRFGTATAVDGVRLEIQAGEVLGFLGPNGAGKSTTMKMLTGFLPPTSGTAVVCGHDVVQEPLKAKACIGYLPEGAPAYPEMTPRTFLDFVADVRGLQGAERRRRIEEVIAKTHLEAVLDQSIETLSKGFKRRVGLAQAILHDPPVLVLDEPTDGLDPNQKHEVRALIREMSREKAIVLSTHILEEVEAVCTRVVIINQGRVVFDGTPTDLIERSRHHNAVRLCVANEEAAPARQKLQQLDGVASVETSDAPDSTTELIVFPSKGHTLLSAVGAAVRDGGWSVSDLRVEQGRLDEVFRELTTSDTITPATFASSTKPQGAPVGVGGKQ